MEKFPFTSEGAAELVAALYALPDAALQAEAAEANADFSGWLLKHFAFEASQVAYLGSMSQTLLSFMGTQVAMAMRHRLKLELIKPLNKGLRDSKLIETKSKIDADGGADGEENASGSVTVEISY
ncbi:hypothetical protein [Pedobacter sp. UBA4863]|uniref:hypothetical protein n=1 Tax=Pedobacter sp. UBA4863 TaxID=1947060 RepID=UPI0025D81AF5|nr:hypothetical protein [Pedobacter sp. UBA4863]